jgi:signal transduction histidine kinase/ActR/RegA family two-component response regulator
MKPCEVIGLPQKDFEKAFPFHFYLDKELNFYPAGKNIQRLLKVERNQSLPFYDVLEFVQPNLASPSFDAISKLSESLCVVRISRLGLILRGQFIPQVESNRILFLGSAWLTSGEDLEKFDLTLTDFALHDPVVDLLQLVQDREIVKKDIDKLVIELRAKTAELSKVNTSLQNQNEELTSARDSAQAATQAKSEFLARMSHEIRTPMHGMLSMIDFLAQKKQDDESQELLAIMKQSSVSLVTIINDILDLSKIESGKMELHLENFKMMDLIKTCLDLYHSSAEQRGIELKYIGPNLDTEVYGDFNKLRQVISNLISNSLKFTTEGMVTIDLTIPQLQADGSLSVEFCIKDTGPGIPKNKVGLLFQNFSQIDGGDNRKQGGTGLGLAISKSLTQLMNGKIWAVEKEPPGAEFRVFIPLKPAQTTLKSQPENSEVPAVFQKLNILVVDDNATNRKIVEILSKKNGFLIQSADSGQTAITKAHTENFDLILMDIQMPEMDGIQTTRKLRGLKLSWVKEVPIVALTANALKGDKERFIDAGLNDYLSKPFTEGAFLETIRKWTTERKNI